jgi:oxygen-independent coproporphyrinogen-3 oxidase
VAADLESIPIDRVVELVERLDVRGPRYTSYPTVPVWRADPLLATKAADDGVVSLCERAEPVALYVHLPFCRSRCLYCGCNSFITKQEAHMRRYVDALGLEIDRLGDQVSGRLRHRHLHLGGGTPTWLPAAWLGELLEQLIAVVPGVPEPERPDGTALERSVEVDPRVTTREHLEALARLGFRRVSIGVQDLDPAVQLAVRREYSLAELEAFIAMARDVGFSGVNLDLIYGLPRQTEQSWATTLEAIVGVGPDRVACFGYAHLPERMKHQQAIVADELPTPNERIRMLLTANRFFGESGFEAIGLDHFARPGDELALARRQGRLWRNFMGYTTTRGLPLLGLGCSGISELESAYTQNLVLPDAYAERLEAGESALSRVHCLDADDRYRKELINHLLCNLELDLSDPPSWAPAGLGDELRVAARGLAVYEQEGLIEPSARGYLVTPLGQLFLRNLAMPFDRYLPSQGATTFSRTV